MPLFLWMVNGITVDGITGNEFAYTPTDGDGVACILTSDATCTTGNPAISNTIIMSVSSIPVTSTISGVLSNGQSECYNAIQTISVAGNGTAFLVNEGGNVTMIAGHNIIYHDGTVVKPGAYMHGYVTTGNQFCPPTVPSIASGTLNSELSNLESGKKSFQIYPNPAWENFTLIEKNGQDSEKISMEIYNMRGEQLLKREFNGGKNHVCRFVEFPPGCYVVKVIVGEYIESFKLIKSREN